MKTKICQAEECGCFHHRLLECMKQGSNDEVFLLLQPIENFCELADGSGKTLLHYPVEYKNKIMVQYLAERGCEVNAQDDSGVTPLMLAVDNENEPVVEMLLRFNADIYITDSDGVSTLQRSFYINVDLLMSNYVIDLFHRPNKARENCQFILKMFFEQVNKDFLADKEKTMKLLLNANDVVKLAVLASCSVEIASFILQNDYKPEFREPKLGLTALHCSSIFGNLKNVQLLIDHGANIGTVNNTGVTPLMSAVKNGHFAVVEILLNNEADVFAIDSNEISTLQRSFSIGVKLLKGICDFQLIGFPYEARKSHASTTDIIIETANKNFLANKETTTKLLLNASSVVKLAVVASCNVELASFILQNDYQIDFREPELGLTALYCAVIMGKFEYVKLLIEHGANIDSLDEKGYSPLHYYINCLQYVDIGSEVLKYFLKNSINLFVQDRDEATDTKYLVHKGTKKTVKTALESGIDIVAALGTWSLQWLLLGNKHLDIHDIIDLGVKIDANLLNPRTSQSALVTEVYRKNLSNVEYLLEHGADVNYFTDKWNPALFYAAVHSFRAKALFEIAESLLLHGADAQIICKDGKPVCDIFHNPQMEMRNLIVAHLAMLAAVDESALTEATRKCIDTNVAAKNYFDVCTKQLDELKDISLCGIVTLFDLLHVKEQTLVRYARKKELRKTCESPIEIKIPNLHSYYINRLQRRISRAFGIVNLEEKVAHTVEALTGFSVDVNRDIVYKIISYLGIQDLKNLSQVEEIKNV